MINTICVIPARGGSTRIPRKNIKEFKGKPMIQRAIETAVQSGLFNAIFVSTDDQEIAKLSQSLGAQVIQRPFELADNDVGTQAVMRHACLTIGVANDDIVCCLYPCTPLLKPNDIVRGVWAIQPNFETPYAMVTDHNGNDQGQYYFGRAWAFKGGLELDDNSCGKVYLPNLIDINTPEDWVEAERLWDAAETDAGGGNAAN